MRAVSASRSRDPRSGPFTLAQGLGPPSDFLWTPGGRLTTESGVPVSPSDRTSQATIYYTAYEHALVPSWSGRRWVGVELPIRPGTSVRELALSVSSISSATLYDVFLVGGRELRLGPAWSSSAAGSSARATAGAISRTLGRYTLTSDPRWLLVGTIYGSGAGTVDDSLSQRYVANAYNVVQRNLRCRDTTDSWTYTLPTYRAARASTTNGEGRVSFVLSLADQLVTSRAWAMFLGTDAGGAAAAVGIGIDSTSSNSAHFYGGSALPHLQTAVADYSGNPGAGFHFLQRLEAAAAIGTVTWYGDAGAGSLIQTGLVAEVWQ